ncbi:1,3-beta-glucanosyltransferase gas1 [Apophysomyces ossiformis]|uniref:1,3-beta-glucanosyltransferase n=1 Tax=Apophysomyces ossiformis TaxID=679940 RepID=A0A8H7EMH3_9FUNG|nr:1,3-beta-glucanosyltransferase gas1 [Apophysomyces ossiformis]
MSKLGLNVVRVYEVDPKKNHDACMKTFADAGLYVLLDIATPKFSINRELPEYDVRLYNAYKNTVDTFGKYDNTFAFIAGNEVTNNKTNTPASAYVKAAVRDIRHYIRSTQKRYIPVGYASNDDADVRSPLKDYFNCGKDEEQVDFYGVNLYEWCGDSTFEKSGFADRTREFANYSKPVFLSEYGCNLVTPRPFSEVEAIYGPQMTEVWSGGVVYEWTQENNNYGLVQLGNSTELLPDYTNLQQALAKINPKRIHMDAYDEQRSASACPQDRFWKASVSLPPTPSEAACQCMQDSLICTASDKVSNNNDDNNTNTLGAQLDMMCGVVPCHAISSNAEKGEYGSFSFCSPKEKLSWLYHLYAKKYKGACDFDGHATKATPNQKNVQTCAQMTDDPSTASHSGNGVGSDTDNPTAGSPSTTTWTPTFSLWIFLLCLPLLF